MIIDNKEYSKVLFVHIPKTAGQSIFKFIDENKLDSWIRLAIRRHDSFAELAKNNRVDEDVFSFAVVRDPYTRTYSCFKQFNKTNELNISFIQYLNGAKSGHIYLETPLLNLPQYKYICDEFKNISITKLYKFENLKELENDFDSKLTFNNVGEYDIEAYNADYTEEAINIVKELYSEDFDLFGYSKEFN